MKASSKNICFTIQSFSEENSAVNMSRLHFANSDFPMVNKTCQLPGGTAPENL